MISNKQSKLFIKELENKQQTKPKVNRRKEIKIRAEVDKMENRKAIEKINKIIIFFKKINKFEKLLTRVTE